MAKNGKSAEKKVSRRGKIIELLQQKPATVEELANQLNKLNKDWAVSKNKAAIRGTLADLKKRGWKVSTTKEGAVSISNK